MESEDDIGLTFPEWFTKEVLLPILPDDWKGYEGLEGKELDLAKSALAKQYVEHGDLSVARIPLSGVLIYDLMFHVQPIVYGLLLSGIGSLYLAMPGMETPKSLAGETIGNKKTEREKLDNRAKQAVDTNVGVLILLSGFLLQIAAVIGVFGNEWLIENYLRGIIPSYWGAISLVIIGKIWYGEIGDRVREWFPYWWNI